MNKKIEGAILVLICLGMIGSIIGSVMAKDTVPSLPLLNEYSGIGFDGCDEVKTTQRMPENIVMEQLPAAIDTGYFVSMQRTGAKRIFGIKWTQPCPSPSVPFFTSTQKVVIENVGAPQLDPIKADIVVGNPTMCLVAQGDHCLIAGTKLTIE